MPHTAIDAAFRFAGKVQQDFWPAGQDNFEIEPGPLVMEISERENFAKQLAPISKVAGAFFEDGDWDMRVPCPNSAYQITVLV